PQWPQNQIRGQLPIAVPYRTEFSSRLTERLRQLSHDRGLGKGSLILCLTLSPSDHEKEPAVRRVPRLPVTGGAVPKAGSDPQPGQPEGLAEGSAGLPLPEPAGPASTGESGHRPAPGPAGERAAGQAAGTAAEPGPAEPEAAATAVAVPAGAAGSPAAGTAGQGPAAAGPGNPAAP